MGMRSSVKITLAVVAVVSIWACGGGQPDESAAGFGTEASGPARIGTAPLTQIGLVVADVSASAGAWSDVLGIPASEVRTVALDLPDETTVEMKVATLSLPNTEIELNQPVTERGPIQEHLDNFGPGAYSIGFAVRDNVDDIRGLLEKRGGTWTGGAPGGEYALLDFREDFGATIKIIRHTASSVQNEPEGTAGTTSLGNQRATHVGLAVRSYDEAARALGDILGIPAVPGNTTDVVYPPGHRWNPTSTNLFLGMTRVAENGMGIELIEPKVGPSPWAEWLEKQRGNALQHIGFEAGTPDGVEEWVRVMESKGGTRTVGVPQAILPNYIGKASSLESTFYAYVDFPDTLGLTLAVTAPMQAPATVAQR